MLLIDTIQALSLKDKRSLVKTIKEIISEDVKSNKVSKLIVKQSKENAKRDKVNEQIRIATEKLARLTAKLAS